MCGEQSVNFSPFVFPFGSPPRVRGTVRVFISADSGKGITPACAGNRPPAPSVPVIAKDHPRVCGEQSTFCTPAVMFAGSPPRVRGTAALDLGKLTLTGITPACAGNRP